MPSTAFIESMLSGLEPNSRRIITKALEIIVSQMKFGPPVHQGQTRNWGAIYVRGVTAGVPHQAFVVEHNLGKVPYVVIPLLNPLEKNAAVLDLAVTQVADDRYLYLSSSLVNVPFWLMVEG